MFTVAEDGGVDPECFLSSRDVVTNSEDGSPVDVDSVFAAEVEPLSVN